MVRQRMASVILTATVCALLIAACSAAGGESADDERDTSSTTSAEEPLASSSSAADSSTSSSSTTTTMPTTTTTKPEPEAETDPEVLAEFVGENNGDFRLDDADLTITEQAADEGKDGIPPEAFVDESAWEIFTVLGLVAPDADLEAVGQQRIDTIRGMCCPVTMWKNDDHPLLRSVVVVHELTHLADIDRAYLDDFDEEDFATVEREQVPLLAVPSEGNASRVHELYREELEAIGARPERFIVEWGGPAVPEVIVRVWEFAYQEGQAFMHALVDRAGQDAVDQAFERPPISSEQVYDIEAYLDNEVPLDVAPPTPPPGAEVVNPQATLGSFVIQVLTEPSLDSAAATTLATSWAGDAAVMYDFVGRRCLEATIVMDDADAAAALVEVLEAASIEAGASLPHEEAAGGPSADGAVGEEENRPRSVAAVHLRRCIPLSDD